MQFSILKFDTALALEFYSEPGKEFAALSRNFRSSLFPVGSAILYLVPVHVVACHHRGKSPASGVACKFS